MSNSKEKQDKLLCIVSVVLVTMCYAVERIVEVSVDVSKSSAVVMMCVFSVCTAIVLAISLKTENAFYSLLSALIGYKMMPPAIISLKELLPTADMIYYLVQKLAVICFIIIIVKTYYKQKDNDRISLVPVLACAVVVPFCMQISDKLGIFFVYQMNKSMLYSYFAQFILYTIAVGFVFLLSYRSGYTTFRFVASYEFVALTINILRKLGVVAVYSIKCYHISLSYYCWIVIYAVLFVAFYLALQQKKKSV